MRSVLLAGWVLLTSMNCWAVDVTADSTVDLTVDASRFFVDGTDQYLKICSALSRGESPPRLIRKQRRTMPNGSFVETEYSAGATPKTSIQTTYTPLLVDKSDSNRPADLTYRFSMTSNRPPQGALPLAETEQAETTQSTTLNGLLKITARSKHSETWTYNVDLAPDNLWVPDRGVLIRTVIVMESDAKGNLIGISGQDYYSNREGVADIYRCTFTRN